MPKVAMDYSKTIIYKIVCNDLSVKDIYVGHTTNFTKRKNQHKTSCQNENGKNYSLKVYRTIREHAGWNNWSMLEIEKYPCNDINEATARERYWYETLNAQLNMRFPRRTIQEYAQDNKEILAEYQKQYKQENKEIIAEYKKQYRENNKKSIAEYMKQKITCDCGSAHTKVNQTRHFKTEKHQQYLNSLKPDKLTIINSPKEEVSAVYSVTS